MDESIAGLVSIFALIMIQAVVTLSYAAVTNIKIGKLRDSDTMNSRARQVLELGGSKNLLLTYQTVTALSHFIIAGVTIMNIATPLSQELINLSPIILYALALLFTLFLTLAISNIVAEAIGSRYAYTFAPFATLVMRLMLGVFSPLVFLLLQIGTTLSALFKSEAKVNTVTEEEIMTVVEAGHTGGTIEDEEKDMIYSVLQLGETYVSEVMVPRIDVVAIEINKTLDEAGNIFVASGFSRIPVYEGNLDSIRGLLYAKDLLAHWTRDDESSITIKDMMRDAYFVPETKRADELLKELQAKKIHLAIVVDEYGGTAGMVTIEDIIEEIIGDIQDEYDTNEEAIYEMLTPDHYIVDAGIDLDDFNELFEVELPTDENETLGGFIYTHFGRVPLINETIDHEDLFMQVLSVDGRRIRKVDVLRKRPEETSTEAQDTEETSPIQTDNPHKANTNTA